MRLDLLTRAAKPATSPADHSQAQTLAAVIGPDCVEVNPRRLRLGIGYAAVFAVTGYPATVGAPWLEPILSWPGRLDVAIHVEPIRADSAAGQLSRQRAKLESSRRIDADKGSSATLASTPPRRTPRTWPTGSLAGRRSCSTPASTSPSTPDPTSPWSRRARRSAPPPHRYCWICSRSPIATDADQPPWTIDADLEALP